MNLPKIIIIGAGGFAKVVYEIIQLQNLYTCIGFIDNKIPVNQEVINGLKVVLTQDQIKNIHQIADYFIVAIGNNKIRKNLVQEAEKYLPAVNIIHPNATISKYAIIGNSNIILANCIINTKCEIGDNCIIDSGCIIDHETKIGNHVHIGIGAIIGNNVAIGDAVKINVGKIIEPFSCIN
jgi:sugar O-acyltransferase (sialic acid O-acetyltransferase NeuD family)